MLIYHPAYDVNHCVYRIVLIVENSSIKRIPLDLIVLQDLYVLFPHLLKEIRPFPANLRSYRKVVEGIGQPYEFMRNAGRVAAQIKVIQMAAIKSLLAKEVLSIESFQQGYIERTKSDLPDGLASLLESDLNAKESWFYLVVNELPSQKLTGKGGLKERSGLLEFRYDVEDV